MLIRNPDGTIIKRFLRRCSSYESRNSTKIIGFDSFQAFHGLFILFNNFLNNLSSRFNLLQRTDDLADLDFSLRQIPVKHAQLGPLFTNQIQ